MIAAALVYVLCAAASPSQCEIHRLETQACAVTAQMTLAGIIRERPEWEVAWWRCR